MYIYIETFRYGNGRIGKQMLQALEKKAKEGVEIKLLIDHWGSQVSQEFFSDLIKNGSELRFFRKFKVTTNFIKYNNRRDHRKILVIDDKFVFLGSSNLAERNLEWREFDVKIEGHFAGIFKDIFLDNYSVYDNYFHDTRSHIFPLVYDTLEIIRDVPSVNHRMIRRKLVDLIKAAKKEVIIETPYFVPDLRFMHHLKQAAKRGVKVILIFPKKSDVRVVQIMMSSFYGGLYKKGIQIKLYNKIILHSKVALIDGETFSFGSANIDHRSFSYMYELNVFGKDKKLRDIVKKHVDESLKGSEDFNYEEWKNRSLWQKTKEVVLIPFRTFM
jgi:cardiolipin synthase